MSSPALWVSVTRPWRRCSLYLSVGRSLSTTAIMPVYWCASRLQVESSLGTWAYSHPILFTFADVDSLVPGNGITIALQPAADLSTMEFKLESNHYATVDDFVSDARLIFANCRQYNGEKNQYANLANKLERALDRILKKRGLAA